MEHFTTQDSISVFSTWKIRFVLFPITFVHLSLRFDWKMYPLISVSVRFTEGSIQFGSIVWTKDDAKKLYNCKNASQCWSNAKIWMKLRRFFLVFYKILPAILTFGLISGVAIIFANSTGDRFAPGYTSLKNILK